MIKLIKKDVMAFPHIITFNCLIVITVMTLSAFDQRGTIAFIGLILYPMILPTNLLLMDGKYFNLCMALPNKRSTYVLSKYVGGYITAFTVLTIGLLYGYILNTYIVKGGIPIDVIFTLKGMALLLLPIILVTSLTFPIFFRFSKATGSAILMILFIVILLVLILGMVYLEKTLPTSLYYTEKDMLPVLMQYIADYIKKVGPNGFLLRIFLGSGSFLALSVALSLWGFSSKDIGGEK